MSRPQTKPASAGGGGRGGRVAVGALEPGQPRKGMSAPVASYVARRARLRYGLGVVRVVLANAGGNVVRVEPRAGRPALEFYSREDWERHDEVGRG